MLTYASDFWPLFWTIIGGGAVLTVLLSLLAATFSPTWFGQDQRHYPVRLRRMASHHDNDASRPGQLRRAA